MKKYFLISSVLALILLIVGAIGVIATGNVFNGASIGISSNGIVNSDSMDVIEKEFDNISDYNKISLNIPNTMLKINKSTNGKITLKCLYDNEGDKYTIKEENGVIFIDRNDIGFGEINFFGINNSRSGVVEMTIPEDLVIEYFVDATNGSIHINDIVAKKMQLITSNGNFELKSVKTEDEAIIKTTNGRIYVEELAANKVNFETSNGMVNITDIKGEYISVKTTNGLIMAKDCYSKDLELKTTNGAITLKNPTDKEYIIENLDVNTTNGIERIDANYKNKQ